MSERPLLASTTSGGWVPLSASRSVVFRSSNDRETRLIVTLGDLALNSLLSWLICAACPPRTSWSHTVSVTLPALATSVLTVAPGVGVDAVEEPPEPGAHAVAAARPTTPTTISSRGLRGFIACSRREGGQQQDSTTSRPPGGSRGHLGVGGAGDGGRGTSYRTDRQGGHDLLEEGVTAHQRGVVGAALAVVAHRGPTVGDVAPAGGGQRPAELLHGEGRAERGEGDPVGQRPAGQGADDHAGPEHVTGAGGVERRHPQRRHVRLLAGGAVDGQRPLGAVGHHREGHP